MYSPDCQRGPVEAEAPQLRLPQARRVSLQSGVQTLNLKLQVAAKSEQVTVAENAVNLRVGKNFTFGRPREPGTAVSSGGNGPPRGLTTGPFSTAAGSQSTGGASSRRYSLSMARSSAISRHPFSVRRTSPMGRASWAGLDSRSQPITGGLNCKHVSPSDRTSKVEQLGENARRPLRAGSNKLEDSDLNGEVYHDRR